MTTYEIGQAITLTATAADSTGAAADTATIAVYILPPGATPVLGVLGPFTPTHTGGGVYEYIYQPPHAGLYWYRFVTTSPEDAKEAWFNVAASQFVT